MTPEDRLMELGLQLPPAPTPVADYVPYVQVGDLVFISGQLPTRQGEVVAAGAVGKELSEELAADAAQVAALNALAQLAQAAGGLAKVRRIVRLGVFVNSAPGFTSQALVANGASQLMGKVFGEAGKHARAAVGVNELPLNAAVEVEMIAQINTPQ